MADNYNHMINVIFATRGDKKTRAAVKKVFTEMNKGEKTTKKASVGMNDFTKAMRRAAIVAPVWMILRTAMMAFFRGFSEGFKYIEEFDRAMMKAKAVVHGAVGDMGDVMDDLRGRIRDLSKETGESMTKIASAFYRFGTVGMEMEKAWMGAEASVRYAMATMGDADDTAKTMAMVFNLLGDTIDENIPITEQYEVQMAKLYKLWQINAFEASQLTESFRQFLPVANTMGISLDETSALLATLNSAALQGSRGGRLLRTSFSKLLDNTDKLANSLGLYVNPELENSFTLFMKVLEVIKDLSKAEGLPIAAQEAISGIFGGVRGGVPVRGLVSLYDELNVNLGITTKSYNELGDAMDDYKTRIDEVKGSISGQLKIFRELRKQVFEQYITGATGAETFAVAIERVNRLMELGSKVSLKLGKDLNYLTQHPFKTLSIVGVIGDITRDADKEVKVFWDKINKGLEGGFDALETVDLASKIETEYPKDDFMLDIAERLKKVYNQKLESARRLAKINKTIVEFDEKHFKKQREINEQKTKETLLTKNILRQTDLLKKSMAEELAILKLQGDGYSKMDISIAKVALEVSKIVDEYNSLDAILAGTVPILNKHQLMTQVLNENWIGVRNSLTGIPKIEGRILAISKLLNATELEKQKILNKQKDTYTDLYMAYEKADMFERGRLKRLMELLKMRPEELGRAFENDMYDKSVITEYFDYFTEAGKNSVEKVMHELLEEMTGMRITLPVDTQLGGAGAIKGAGLLKQAYTTPTPAPIPITQTNIGAQNVQVDVTTPSADPEEIADLTSEKVKEGLLLDDEFQKAFSKKIRNKI